MTTNPKRTYTPEQIQRVVDRLNSLRTGADHEAANMLESLASQLAAQKRECKPLPKPELLIALRDEIDDLSNAEPIISDVYDMNKWMEVLEEAAQQLRDSQPSPDQDREVSP